MPNQKVDLLIKISYDLKKPEKSLIQTNVKPERLQDLLGDYLHDQMGRGGDGREQNMKEVYNITIGIDLSDDTFYTSSDTGNDGLTCGIILNVCTILNQLKVLPL